MCQCLVFVRITDRSYEKFGFGFFLNMRAREVSGAFSTGVESWSLMMLLLKDVRQQLSRE